MWLFVQSSHFIGDTMELSSSFFLFAGGHDLQEFVSICRQVNGYRLEDIQLRHRFTGREVRQPA